jgi:hypothetical protein
MFPAHTMTATIRFGGRTRPIEVRTTNHMITVSRSRPTPPASPFGAEARDDGIVITGSAAFYLYLRSQLTAEDITALEGADSLDLLFRMGVAGGAKPVSLTARFSRVKRDDDDPYKKGINAGFVFAGSQPEGAD